MAEARNPRPEDSSSAKNPDPRREWMPNLTFLAVMFVLLWFWQDAFDRLTYLQVPYSEFKEHLAAGEVLEAEIGEEWVRGRLAPGAVTAEETAPPRLPGLFARTHSPDEPQLFETVRVEDPKLVDQLTAAGVRFVGVRPGILSQLLWAWILPIGVMLLFWMFLFRKMGAMGQTAMTFGKSHARLVADRETGVSFEDVAGCEEAKHDLEEVVAFLREPERFRKLGARIPKGVLLVGPPGTGKTLLARAVAGEAKVPFFSLSGSEFVEMFVGVGAARVRDLFQQAKTHAPCIVFIDELDAIGRQRGVSMGVTHEEREQTLNQLLVEMDGFEANVGVILLSATNRPDVLDRALLRPGRFDRQVLLDAPDLPGRLAILGVHTRGKPIDSSVDLWRVARSTPGLAGADLANIVNEAALLAAREGASKIDAHHFEEAVERVVAGPERRSRRLGDADRRRVAVHETGHAVVAAHCPQADPVHKITIVPRGKAALGYTLQLPVGEQPLLTRGALLDRVKTLLGGRAAEELVLGEISTGAENDLDQATAIVRQMITMFGMGESVGLAHCARPAGPEFLSDRMGSLQRDCSEDTARSIDEEVISILDAAHAEAQSILEKHREALDRVAESLFERETLTAADFYPLIGLPAPERAAALAPPDAPSPDHAEEAEEAEDTEAADEDARAEAAGEAEREAPAPVATQAHHEALTSRARAQHDALTAAIEVLERALAAAATHREEAWAERASKALHVVRETIRAHAEGVEEAGSLFDELEAVQPRLAPQIAGLRKEHGTLARRAAALAQELALPAETTVSDLRREAAALLSDLRAHRAVEADLIYEAFWTELGGGD